MPRPAPSPRQIASDTAQLEELSGLYAAKAITAPEWIAARQSIEARRTATGVDSATYPARAQSTPTSGKATPFVTNGPPSTSTGNVRSLKPSSTTS